MSIGIGRQVNSIGFSPLAAALVCRSNADLYQLNASADARYMRRRRQRRLRPAE
jgi:hypothetical protein